MEEPSFPAFDYFLDESGPDIVVLCLQDGAFVAAFSVRGATKEGILKAAKKDYRERIRAYRRGSGDSTTRETERNGNQKRRHEQETTRAIERSNDVTRQ
jgi:hypothetical protein